MTKEEIVRNYYKGWEKKDWKAIERLFADRFTFTSPNGDDHIDRAAFYSKCWPQADWIEHFDLESLATSENEACVKYLCKTKNGKSFRNIECFRFTKGKVEAVECYFGGRHGYPSAASLDRSEGSE